MLRVLLALIALLLLTLLLAAQPTAPPKPDYHFALSFDNRTGGDIKLTDLMAGEPSERNIYVLGHVVRPATGIRELSFHATLWGKSSTVVASAVNAVHIKVFGLASLDRGSSITIAPHELYGKNLDGTPGRLLDYTIYTDIESGVYLFGGSFSPPQGSAVRCMRGGEMKRLELGFVPQVGDEFLIEVRGPVPSLRSLSFENRPKGRVEAEYSNMTRVAVGFVTKPVSGVGRFEGGYLSPPSTIRASHAGVIDISTSGRGQVGGFQIIPWNHSRSREMVKSQIMPQYMIVDSFGGGELTGVPPLFGPGLFPRVNDRVEPPLTSLGGRRVEVDAVPHLPQAVVLADFGAGLVPLPVRVGKDDNALLGLERLVIRFE
jgi:hypothetical protein